MNRKTCKIRRIKFGESLGYRIVIEFKNYTKEDMSETYERRNKQLTKIGCN